MNREFKGSLKSFLVELLVYSALIVGYFFLVQHFLAGWIVHLFQGDRRIYAVAALALIVGQGIALEMLTAALFAIIKPRMDDK
jgi:biotin transporter BioY